MLHLPRQRHALNANTGAVIWKTYTIADEPKPRGKNKEGVQLWGPAGGGVWAAPTVDAQRRAIYVATGNGYAEPRRQDSDAVLAFDMNSGKHPLVSQPLANDVWVGGCRPAMRENPNCPAELGPDLDFSMSPMLVEASRTARDLLIVQQKSGMVYAFDPDKKGAKVWEYRASPGGGMGGQWGAAADDRQAYFSVNGTAGKTPAVCAPCTSTPAPRCGRRKPRRDCAAPSAAAAPRRAPR